MIHVRRLVPVLALAAAVAACNGQQVDHAADEEDTMPRTAMPSPSSADSAACDTGQPATTGPIEIGLTPGGKVEVKPDPHIRLKMGNGAVKFTSPSGLPFALFFDPENGDLPTQAATRTVPANGNVTVRVNPNVECGAYEYHVAVWDAANGRVVPLDPPLYIVP